jgi:hypothetical protein
MSFKKILKNIIEISIVGFSVMYMTVLFAATPNPGHSWLEIGDTNGRWATTGTTAYRTFTFPDASSTVLTDFTPVTVLQGGTGSNATGTAFNVLTGLTTKGDLFIRGASSIGRLALSSNGQVLTADSLQPLGVKWSPIVITPAGLDTQIQFNDGGVLGATSTFTFDKVNQILGLHGEIDLGAEQNPPAPVADTLRVFSKKISGRSMLKAISPYGIDYAYQPSFFQNSIFIISTGAGTAYSTIGNTLTSVGTISHVVSEPLGYMANQVTGAVAGNTAGSGSATFPYFRGSQVGSNGFFFQARMAFPDATSTGIRAFVGFASGTMATSVASDNPAGSNIGWQYSTARADTGWKFMTKDGTTQTVSSTVLPFAVNAIMDFFIYCPPFPNNTIVYYRIDNVSSSTSAEGTTSSTLPAGTTPLGAGFQINNIAASARNVRLNRLYVETDK